MTIGCYVPLSGENNRSAGARPYLGDQKRDTRGCHVSSVTVLQIRGAASPRPAEQVEVLDDRFGTFSFRGSGPRFLRKEFEYSLSNFEFVVLASGEHRGPPEETNFTLL